MARVPLSKIQLEEDEMIVEGFEGELEGIRVWVTAVLERTCVYETPDLERKLVSKSKILVELDLDGQPVRDDGQKLYLERFIHAAIFAARPDVMAVVHAHAEDTLPFGIAEATKLRPVIHSGSFIGASVPVWDIADQFGDATNLLVINMAQGRDMARVLGKNSVVLMRGHGSVAVGDSIQQVVHRAIYTEVNARLQAEAAKLGPINFLTPEEAVKADAQTDSKASLSRPWELWKARVGKIE